MKSYWTSSSARLGALTLGLAIAGLGASALAGPAHALAVQAAVPPFLITGALLTTGLALMEFPRHAIALTLGLPALVCPGYFGLMLVAPRAGAAVGTVLAALGLSILAHALVGRPPRRAVQATLAEEGAR